MPSSANRQGSIDRRSFLSVSGSCAAHMMLMTSGAGSQKRNFAASGRAGQVLLREPWGRLEKIADGVWALISTPLDGDRTTLCNGGIIAGDDGALVVESFATSEGAEWMALKTRELTGRWPSHVVLTHLHSDHSGGLEGFSSGAADLSTMTTALTRELIHQNDAAGGRAVSAVRARMLADVAILDDESPTTVDLGGKTVHLIPRRGHTPSDVTVELADPSIVFCGDLVWNHMFPNYRDTIPSSFASSVRSLMRDRDTIYVPGHGALSDNDDIETYLDLIDDVAAAARRAIDEGVPIAEAAAGYSLPESIGEWVMFRPQYFEVAFRAWERELVGG